jgi:hypothetical protein
LANFPAARHGAAGTKEAAMSLRSLAALGLLLFLWACNAPGKPTDPSINEIEHRHDEMMRGLGGGGGGGGGGGSM